jgi:hypothetical protein
VLYAGKYPIFGPQSQTFRVRMWVCSRYSGLQGGRLKYVDNVLDDELLQILTQ